MTTKRHLRFDAERVLLVLGGTILFVLATLFPYRFLVGYVGNPSEPISFWNYGTLLMAFLGLALIAIGVRMAYYEEEETTNQNGTAVQTN